MTHQQFLQAYRSLPDEAKRQVADFVAFLQQKYQADQPEQEQLGKRFDNEPFIGMWQDRLELEDSTAWVRQARQTEWGSNS
ncbi:MAG: DUF2281 domain-containing protein [Anaerolineae bacterium]|nr:DUF2281 domain-containing protein [Anaerolineae bacterium]